MLKVVNELPGLRESVLYLPRDGKVYVNINYLTPGGVEGSELAAGTEGVRLLEGDLPRHI